MPKIFSFGNRLLRTALSLGFLCYLVGQGNVFGQAALSQRPIVVSDGATGTSGASPSVYRSRLERLNKAEVQPSSVAFARSAGDSEALAFPCSDSVLGGQVNIGLPDEFGVSLEDDDGIEMVRVDLQQRAFGIDRVEIGLKVPPTAARNMRTNISPPLLV